MKKQLLIVDDDISLSTAVSDYLVDQGFSVVSADSVNSALNVMQDKEIKPDMIITDIMMPYIDGYEFLKIIRLDNLLSNIPIILLTAKGMTQDRIRGYDLGCNAYLTKPFSPEELLSIIHNLFNNISLLQTVHKQKEKNDIIDIDHRSTLMNELTYRECTILQLVVQGYRNKEIAKHLQVSTRNVEKYVSRLLNKTSTRNRTELAKLFANYFIKGE